MKNAAQRRYLETGRAFRRIKAARDLGPAVTKILVELEIIPAPRRSGRPQNSHCVRGHELVGDNVRLYRQPSGYTLRSCRICAHERYKDKLVRRVLSEQSSTLDKAKEATCR